MTLMSLGQYRELAAAAIKQLPIKLDGAIAQMLIDNPRLLAVYMEDWFASVRHLEVSTRELDPLMANIERSNMVQTLTLIDTFRNFFPMAVLPDAAKKRDSGDWQREFLCILDEQEERVRGTTFRPVVVKAKGQWKMPHMMAHLRSKGFEPALPQHLLHVEVRHGSDAFDNTRLVVCPTPLVLERRNYYLAFDPGMPATDAKRWRLYGEFTSDNTAWCDNEVVLAVATD